MYRDSMVARGIESTESAMTSAWPLRPWRKHWCHETLDYHVRHCSANGTIGLIMWGDAGRLPPEPADTACLSNRAVEGRAVRWRA